MALVRKMLRQQAVWWRKTGTDRFGKGVFADPVQIKCRWENRMGQYFNAKGEANDSKATVYVGQELSVGDVLSEGELESGTPDDPKMDPTAFPIKGFDIIPSLRNNPGKTLFVAHL